MANGWLVLTRREGESIKIGDDVTVYVVKSRERSCILSIQAPLEVNIVRTELLDDERGLDATGPR